jgi:hypothetical protein
VITLDGDDGFGSGAVVPMIGPLQTTPEPLFDGAAPIVTGHEPISFYGLTVSNAGLAAPSDATIAVLSTDDGGSFTATQSGIPTEMGDPLLWLGGNGAGKWLAFDSSENLLTATASTLSSGTEWAVDSIENSPDSTPATIFYATPDGSRAVYIDPETDPSEGYPQVYLYPAGDGGSAGVFLAGLASNAGPPQVLAFADSMHGMLAGGSNPGEGATPEFFYVTSNGGSSWTEVPSFLPASVSGFSPEFTTGFYSPDGGNLWLGGVAATDNSSILLLSENHGLPFPDAGTSFIDLSAKVQEVIPRGGFACGFALDSSNIWLGAQNGALLYSPTGGQ